MVAKKTPMDKNDEPQIIAALRRAFPYFASNAPITPEAIEKLGAEFLEMIHHWEPSRTEIAFLDQNGTTRIIRRTDYEDADSDVLFDIPAEADWIVSQKSPA